MAMLPEDLEEKTVGGMLLGEEGYAVPWAMFVASGRRCFLNGYYTIHDEMGGTVNMKVLRRNDGYAVDVSGCGDYKWSGGGRRAYVGGADAINVVEILGQAERDEG